MDWLFGGFSKQTLTSNLIAMKHRMRLRHEKTRNDIERNKREIAQLVRIRIEWIISMGPATGKNNAVGK